VDSLLVRNSAAAAGPPRKPASKARTKLTPTSARTREQLILAGERLFAERGLDNVSLRQINSAAGQRNSSAAHYHFGSKEALVSALYHYRLGHLDARRTELMQQRAAAGAPRTVGALVEVVLLPIVEEVETSEGGQYFIRFLSQMLCHPKLDLVNMWRTRLNDSMGVVFAEMRDALPELPTEVFGHRFGLMWLLAINTLADRERISSRPDTKLEYRASHELFISSLRDALTGLISAPVSAATRALITGSGAGSGSGAKARPAGTPPA